MILIIYLRRAFFQRQPSYLTNENFFSFLLNHFLFKAEKKMPQPHFYGVFSEEPFYFFATLKGQHSFQKSWKESSTFTFFQHYSHSFLNLRIFQANSQLFGMERFEMFRQEIPGQRLFDEIRNEILQLLLSILIFFYLFSRQ